MGRVWYLNGDGCGIRWWGNSSVIRWYIELREALLLISCSRMPRCFLLSFYSMVVTINYETFSYDDTNSKLRGASVININVFRHNKRYLCLWRSFRDRTWVRICSRLDWSDFLLPASAPSPLPWFNPGQSQRWWAAGGSFYLFVDNWALFISGHQSLSLCLSYIFCFF